VKIKVLVFFEHAVKHPVTHLTLAFDTIRHW